MLLDNVFNARKGQKGAKRVKVAPKLKPVVAPAVVTPAEVIEQPAVEVVPAPAVTVQPADPVGPPLTIEDELSADDVNELSLDGDDDEDDFDVNSGDDLNLEIPSEVGGF